MHLLFRSGGRRKSDVSQVSRRLPVAGNHGGVANGSTLSGFFAAAHADRACQRVGGVASAEVLIVPAAQEGFAMPESIPPASSEIVLLSGPDLRRLLSPQVAIEALRETYGALANHRGDQGRSVGFTVKGGSIHVKSGLLPGSHLAFASKVNVNLPDNARLRGLPTIQGVVVVSDARDGRPLAIMESITLTGIRTAATAALAAQYGARKGSKRAAIIGCGAQAKYQLEAMRTVLPLQSVRVFDIDAARAKTFAAACSTPACLVETTS